MNITDVFGITDEKIFNSFEIKCIFHSFQLEAVGVNALLVGMGFAQGRSTS